MIVSYFFPNVWACEWSGTLFARKMYIQEKGGKCFLWSARMNRSFYPFFLSSSLFPSHLLFPLFSSALEWARYRKKKRERKRERERKEREREEIEHLNGCQERSNQVVFQKHLKSQRGERFECIYTKTEFSLSEDETKKLHLSHFLIHSFYFSFLSLSLSLSLSPSRS